MVLQQALRLSAWTSTFSIAAIFAAILVFAAPRLPFLPSTLLGAGSFVILFLIQDALIRALDSDLRKRRFDRTETRIVMDFVERLRVSFTVADLVEAARDCLEMRADASVLLIKSATWETVYASPSTLAKDPDTLATLHRNFREWSEGFAFLSDDYGLHPSNAGCRGYLSVCKGYHLFVFSRSAGLAELEAFRILHGELQLYFDRIITVARLFNIANLSKEWSLIAETQKSFLPKEMPKLAKLETASYYRPLVNVSGDYYDVIPIDYRRTLLVVGDVSGKGLAAALIMGIIVNTIRVAPDKTDLPLLIRGVDEAIRGMRFEDKYTVIFLGIVDTGEKVLRYVNASMADPLVISQTALGAKPKKLGSTMGLLGLLPLEGEIPVEEVPLRTDDVILIASDGLLELENNAGESLNESAAFERLLQQSSRETAESIVEGIAGFAYSFVEGRQLRDDITILAAKVGRLWD